jgi:hypothetical protein
MATERSKALPIFLAVAVLAAGAGYYFFKIYSPKQQKLAAQAEIDGWEMRWKAARDCLLGPTPGSSKTSEALAIREMNPDPWNRGTCTPLISKLNRGDEPDTGIKDIEAAWVELDKSAGRAAGAFATHIASSTTLKDDPLPTALDQLDAARVELRKAAAMPAIEQSGKPLRAAQIIAITDGDAPIKEVSVETKPSAHGMIIFGQSKTRDVEIALHTNAAPTVGAIDGTLRSVPDMKWGAHVVADGQAIDIGAIDDTGKMPTATTQKLAQAGIAAIVGSAQSGEVVYGNDKQLIVSHANAGVTTTDPPIAATSSRAAIDVDGRVALMWLDGKLAHGRILRPGADEPAVELGDVALGAMCLTKDRAWVTTATGVMAFGGTQPVVNRANPFYTMLGCTADVALFRSMDPHKPFLICTDDCRTATLAAGAPELSAVTVVGGKLVAIASHDAVLGVWREGAPVEFFGLPEPADPLMAHEWSAMAMSDGSVVDVVARGHKGHIVIRIPAN